MNQITAGLVVFPLMMLSLAAGNTGKIAKPDTNENRYSTCAEGKCQKIVTHRCYCSSCDSTPTGSECPCVQNNRGLVQQTIYPGQCVEVFKTTNSPKYENGTEWIVHGGVHYFLETED